MAIVMIIIMIIPIIILIIMDKMGNMIMVVIEDNDVECDAYNRNNDRRSLM